ncbi:MAG: RdgB/HAM1 family non-canonical purine NTP pyrophosphatase [Clostridia bacterium]|nr:RdgB/HAM1 family non-canonical purine NTP pyrophosphatase [Clostridia bacterium]
MKKNKINVVVATTNVGKLQEIRDILKDYDIVSVADVGFSDDVEETGQTFMENALLKARTVCKAVGLPTIGDDSGLCVDALGGAPGIFSARYSGQGVPSNRQLLLKNLLGVENRTAHFNCAVALVFPDGREYTAEGQTYGVITEEESCGGNGFGYDCLFYSNDLGKTFAEATAEEKHTVSHRGRALQNLLVKLED